MSDITDEASDVESMWNENAIRQAHIEANQPNKTFKACQFCGEPTDAGAEFCSYGPGSCATDANWRREILTKQGLA